MTGGHRHERPTWECEACGKDWPCDPAREELAMEHDRTGLAILMWTYLEDYAMDSGTGSLAGAFERFIAWTRSA